MLFSFIFVSQHILSQNLLAEDARQRAVAVFDHLDTQNAYRDSLNRVDMNMLPSGYSQSINNMQVSFAVYEAEFFPEYTSISAFLRIVMPAKENRELFFAAKDIKLSHDGDIIGDAKLTLLSDIEIPISGGNVILRLKGDFNKKTGVTSDLTYASIDCKGLKGLGISAEVELSNKLCYKAGTTGDSTQHKVIGKFQTEIENWNDIVAQVSFPSFCIKGLKDFIWTVEDAVFDFSDLKNAQNFTFPEGYDQYLIPGNEMLWQGVYVRNLAVTLPPQFSKGEDKRVSFSAHDMIIDDNGISGTFGAHNILSINEGNASGWAFSVDYFGLKLMANTLEGAEFNGMIGLPVSERTNLKYNGLIA
ncbi:hypothetical protein D0T66_03265, partial [Dysgonomonas sp. 25]|nr:hypothetical protein [Dysgonomonas sp. 25]